MHIGPLLNPRQQTACIVNCPAPAPCACSANQECVQINRDCYTCGETRCVNNVTSQGSSASVSKGALAGAVVGSVVFLALAVCMYLWFRRTSRLRTALKPQDVKDVPAPASTVLNRPDPTEKPTPDPSIIDDTASLQPPYVFSRDGNPFDDSNSIQTAGTGGTNVIPIALISTEQSIRSGTDSLPSINSGPIRPARSPELNLNLDHVNVSNDNLRPAQYEASTRSGVSAASSGRHSYMSGMTYASDFLTEAPMIMTPTKGPIRQVMGVAKPEVINAGSISSHASSETLKPPPTYSKPVTKSPLAATSFGPTDILKEVDEKDSANPFDDKHFSTNADYSLSPPPSATTIQTTRQDRESTCSSWTPDGPTLPWAHQGVNSRPSSMSTQAGSVIDIASATRVNVGLMTPETSSSGSRSPYRTTMGHLVSPTSGASTGSLQEQQARALAHAQAQAQAQGLDKPRPISGSSVISATSTRADSILESFPFVPPSPISNRPIRSPPVSPLGQSTFGTASSPLAQHTFVVAPPSPQPNTSFSQEPSGMSGALPAPPSRQTLGMSTASQLSTASTGLGSFPFQIDSGTDRPESLQPPSLFNRQRASLDTLALTSDLSSYPLGFDRDSVPVPKNGRI